MPRDQVVGGRRLGAQGRRQQRHRRPGRTGRRAAGRRDDEGEEVGPDPRFAAADAALERGDFAAAEAEFDQLLQANPADAEAKAGKAQAGLLARASALDPQAVLTAAAAADATVADQLAAADLELATGRVEEAFDRLIGQIKAADGHRAGRGPDPAARALRHGGQRRSAGAEGAPRADDRPVLRPVL